MSAAAAPAPASSSRADKQSRASKKRKTSRKSCVESQNVWLFVASRDKPWHALTWHRVFKTQKAALEAQIAWLKEQIVDVIDEVELGNYDRCRESAHMLLEFFDDGECTGEWKDNVSYTHKDLSNLLGMLLEDKDDEDFALQITECLLE